MSTPGNAPGPAALQPGFVLLERYRLEHELGPGDLGTQWRALDQKEDKAVLVEVLPPGPPLAPQEIKALQDVCSRITGLRHEGLARVVQFGFLGPQPVVVRELITGLSLSDRADRHGPVEPSVARGWLAPVAAALDMAHSKGVVHGHLRAAAVRFRSDGSPVLTGFELSPFHPDPPGAPRSPEQRLGRAATPASDRYALAAMAAPLLGESHPEVTAALRAAQADEPGKRPATSVEVLEALATAAPPRRGLAGGVVAVVLGLGLMIGGPYMACQRLAAREPLVPAPVASKAADPIAEAPPSASPPSPSAVPTSLPPEPPLRIELGEDAPELTDPRAAVGRFTARVGGQDLRPATAFVVNLDGRAGLVVTAHSFFGTGGGLSRPLAASEIRRVVGPRLELGSESFQVGQALVLPRAGAASSLTRPAHDVAAFLVDRPRPGFELRRDRLVRDEPLMILTWTGELYRAVAEPQLSGARTYRFPGDVPPASALGAPVLDRRKQVVGIHLGTNHGYRGVTGMCTDSGVIRLALLRALAPLFRRVRDQREAPRPDEASSGGLKARAGG